ncbi:MAG: hypothetical protein PHG35_01325 [Dehalococcoidales bacterium]|nr:hypothetical protein [Dehalococcoidales bacterium]
MHMQQWILLAIMAAGGVAVIGSYIQGFKAHSGGSEVLWGGVKGRLRILNYVTMLLAVIGFFAFSYWLFFQINPDNAQIGGRIGYWIYYVIFLLILIPSALWMPLTFAYMKKPSFARWIGVRLALALVGIGSLALLWAIICATPRDANVAYWFAVGGAAAFSLQTAVMDMLIWPALFKV